MTKEELREKVINLRKLPKIEGFPEMMFYYDHYLINENNRYKVEFWDELAKRPNIEKVVFNQIERHYNAYMKDINDSDIKTLSREDLKMRLIQEKELEWAGGPFRAIYTCDKIFTCLLNGEIIQEYEWDKMTDKKWDSHRYLYGFRTAIKNGTSLEPWTKNWD